MFETNVELFALIHHGLYGTWLGAVFVFCQTPAGVVMLSILALLAARPKHPYAAVVLRVVVSIAISAAICQILKEWVREPRPHVLVPDLVISTDGVDAKHTKGWPSGHTTTVFTFAGAILALRPRWWLVLLGFLVATFGGLGRVVVGVHFPFDILAGAVLGGLCGWLPRDAFDALEARFARRRETAPALEGTPLPVEVPLEKPASS